jgi:hypothetical protein
MRFSGLYFILLTKGSILRNPRVTSPIIVGRGRGGPIIDLKGARSVIYAAALEEPGFFY